MTCIRTPSAGRAAAAAWHRRRSDAPKDGGHCAARYPAAVSTAPVPRPPVPASPGSGTVPTTRNAAARGAPSGDVTVTRTVPPMRVPASRMVVTPSAISWSPAGSRPSAVDSSTGPRTAAVASARTLTVPTVIAGTVTAVIRSIAGSRMSSLTRFAGGLAPGAEDVMTAWNGSPYSSGEAIRCARLAPNTAVAHSAAIAATAPVKAVRTGADRAPRPTACPMPRTAATGRPIAAAAAAISEGRGTRAPSRNPLRPPGCTLTVWTAIRPPVCAGCRIRRAGDEFSPRRAS